MGPQYVELERDLTLLLWLGISVNDNLSQKQGVHWRLSYLSILSERTVWFRFLTVTKALIGDQHKYTLLAGLWLVKFHGLLHYVDQIKKFGSPLRYYFGGWLFGIILEGQAQENKQENQRSPAQSATWHFDFDLLTRVSAVLFNLARQILFPMEYAPVFCGTNLLSLDELQVHGEGDSNTEYWGILHREQYLSSKTKPNYQDSCEQIKVSCCTLCRWPLILLLVFLSLSFKNDSKK